MNRTIQTTRSTIRVFGVLAGLLCSVKVLADGQFYLKVDPRRGSINELYNFSVVIQDLETSSKPILKGGDDFELQYVGPQTRIEMVNGHVSSQKVYLYQLTPKKIGTLTTPSAELDVNGETLSADALSLQVAASEQADVTATENKDVMLQQSVEQTQIYEGQQLVMKVDLLTNRNLFEPKLPDLSADGFWTESFGEDSRSRRVVNGQQFQVVEMRRVLFPLKSGELELPARELRAKVEERSSRSRVDPFDPFAGGYGGGLFDNFFGQAEYKEIRVLSGAVKVTVLPLPAAPERGPSWDGPVIVGHTELRASYSGTPVGVGQGKTLEVTITSTGNLNSIKELPIKGGSDFKVYQEGAKEQKVENSGLMLTKKTFTLTVVPIHPGRLALPPLRLGYFDPVMREYKVALAGDIAFDVTGGEELQPSGKVDSSSSTLPTSKIVLSSGTTPIPLSAPATEKTARPALQEVDLPALAAEFAAESDQSLSSRITETVSTSLALLILAASVLLSTVLYLIFGASKGRRAPENENLKALELASSPTQLLTAVSQIIAQQLADPQAALHLDALRLKIREKWSSRANFLEVLELIDKLESQAYGSARPDPAALENLRKQAARLM